MDINKQHKYYMSVAELCSQNSYCKRLQVGAVIVRQNQIISDGFNGTPSGFPNHCECEDGSASLPIVIHAEANAICKLAKLSGGGEGATLYVTHAPCVECAKMIIQTGINTVVYKTMYRDDTGLKLLEQKVKVFQI